MRDERENYSRREENVPSYRPPPRGVGATWGSGSRRSRSLERRRRSPSPRRRRSRSRERRRGGRRYRSPSEEDRFRPRRRRPPPKEEKSKSRSKSRSLSWSPPPAVRRQMAEAKARRAREEKEGRVKQGKFWDGFRWVEHTPASQMPSNPATRKERRLYVGNLPNTFDSDQLRVFLNEALRHCGAVPQGVDEVVVSSWVSPDKKFAFVELSTVEAATTALGLSGISCMGCSLKICHPNNYQISQPLLANTDITAASLAAQNPELVAAALAAINSAGLNAFPSDTTGFGPPRPPTT
ncbi:hypothetical protein CTAYLR_004469 [Chrysophaeum taylorii]|uniref:RRM domain-containing protein n=1 Tax=Chrysophaeum taylorii TaxID=2483200 RepID=A0AAD7UBW0_9STRA|nr:hypothetical protein CTAYLR_004469 [Chrysophaeum taylorii]